MENNGDDDGVEDGGTEAVEGPGREAQDMSGGCSGEEPGDSGNQTERGEKVEPGSCHGNQPLLFGPVLGMRVFRSL